MNAISPAGIPTHVAAAVNAAYAARNAVPIPLDSRVVDGSTGSWGRVTGLIRGTNMLRVTLDSGYAVDRFPADLRVVSDRPRGNGNGSAIARLDALLDVRA